MIADEATTFENGATLFWLRKAESKRYCTSMGPEYAFSSLHEYNITDAVLVTATIREAIPKL